MLFHFDQHPAKIEAPSLERTGGRANSFSVLSALLGVSSLCVCHGPFFFLVCGSFMSCNVVSKFSQTVSLSLAIPPNTGTENFSPLFQTWSFWRIARRVCRCQRSSQMIPRTSFFTFLCRLVKIYYRKIRDTYAFPLSSTPPTRPRFDTNIHTRSPTTAALGQGQTASHMEGPSLRSNSLPFTPLGGINPVFTFRSFAKPLPCL